MGHIFFCVFWKSTSFSAKEYVDLQNDVIAVKGTKTKYDRYIPISKPLKSILDGIEKKDDCLYVFNKNGAKIGAFKRSFHTACLNAGLKDLRVHDLRHVFASKMVMNDIFARTVIKANGFYSGGNVAFILPASF